MEASVFAFDVAGSSGNELLAARVRSSIDLTKLFAAVDADPQLIGAGIKYIDGAFNVVELRRFVPVCRTRPIYVVLKEPDRPLPPAEYAAELRTKTRESRLAAELLGAGLSCTGAVLGWVVVLGSGALIPFSGGASAVITVVGTAAATASTVQCFNSVVRASAEVLEPEFNDALDSQAWYSNTVVALDLISLAGAGASGLTTVRYVLITQRATGKSMLEIVKGLNRMERTRVTKELLKVQNPQISNAMRKALQKSGELPKRFSAAQVRTATLTQIKDAVAGTFGFLGSASTGTVKSLVVGVFGEVGE